MSKKKSSQHDQWAMMMVMFTLVGIIFLTISYNTYSDTKKFINSSALTTGYVVDIYDKYSGGSTTYAPIVEFSDSSGQVIRFTSKVSSNPASYRVGELVSIIYDKNHPSNAIINDFFSVYGSAIVTAILGCGFFFCGIGTIAAIFIKRK
ncbi:DUF3592 domain-containing protein [Thalassotalea ganghwensis]